MIELVFVIVVLGILAAVAIPKFAATRTDAQISKGRADVASIRSGIISDRQVRLITGDPKFIEAGNAAGQLDAGAGAAGSGPLFGGVLSYPVADSYWKNVTRPDVNSSTYTFTAGGASTTFSYHRNKTIVGGVTYKAGTFTCTAGTANASQKLCAKLIN